MPEGIRHNIKFMYDSNIQMLPLDYMIEVSNSYNSYTKYFYSSTNTINLFPFKNKSSFSFLIVELYITTTKSEIDSNAV